MLISEQANYDGAELDAVFSAVAHPVRRQILDSLRAGETTVGDLAAPLTISAPAVSRHLAVLERAGLIERRRDAQWRPCRLTARPLQDAAEWLSSYAAFWSTSFDALDDHLTQEDDSS